MRFLFGTGYPVWEIWLCFDAGTAGVPLGMGKDQSLAVLSKELHDICSSKASRVLRVSDFQFALQLRKRGYYAL